MMDEQSSFEVAPMETLSIAGNAIRVYVQIEKRPEMHDLNWIWVVTGLNATSANTAERSKAELRVGWESCQ